MDHTDGGSRSIAERAVTPRIFDRKRQVQIVLRTKIPALAKAEKLQIAVVAKVSKVEPDLERIVALAPRPKKGTDQALAFAVGLDVLSIENATAAGSDPAVRAIVVQQDRVSGGLGNPAPNLLRRRIPGAGKRQQSICHRLPLPLYPELERIARRSFPQTEARRPDRSAREWIAQGDIAEQVSHRKADRAGAYRGADELIGIAA